MRVLRSMLLGAGILVPCSAILFLGFLALIFLVDNYPIFIGMVVAIFSLGLTCYFIGSSVGYYPSEHKTEDDVREEVINDMQTDKSYINELMEKHRNKELDIKTYHEFKSLLKGDEWKGHLGFGSTGIKYKEYLEKSCKYWEEKYQL